MALTSLYISSGMPSICLMDKGAAGQSSSAHCLSVCVCILFASKGSFNVSRVCVSLRVVTLSCIISRPHLIVCSHACMCVFDPAHVIVYLLLAL